MCYRETYSDENEYRKHRGTRYVGGREITVWGMVVEVGKFGRLLVEMSSREWKEQSEVQRNGLDSIYKCSPCEQYLGPVD